MQSWKVPALTLLLACGGVAHGQYRCDCTSVVDTCTANVAARGSFLEVKTDRPQCARVDYFVDGQPFVSMVVDGEDRQNWPARTANPKILVQSCQVCRDNGASAAVPVARTPPPAAAAQAPGGEGADAGLKPLIAVVPEYPTGALLRGLKGHVDVEFTVNSAGRVENARVVTAEPKGAFDAAALAAVQRRRYAEDSARTPQVVQERFDFQPPRAASRAAAFAASGPRNQCVRQDAVYNYGEMVDVGLINACSDALVVFACAQGTGRNAGRWVCNTSEESGDVLVGSGDQRIGKRYAAGDAATVRTYTYTDSFSVTRAPNSEYWWVACVESDTECRSGARQWTRAVGGQDASVDPQDRSTITVARSY
ncbi:MAG: TonB family protein [Gammaproteobacteria bacterium]